ncbi:MAG: hypothetical protein B1H40_01690 [Candidatus Latescibacteria bacterium 4484_181]|nr:MAG: hypothetical protein B1H40_01690 [Candidatus Latescibacteria bacterium 4484_181]
MYRRWGEVALSVSGQQNQSRPLLPAGLIGTAIGPYFFATPTESALLLVPFLVKKSKMELLPVLRAHFRYLFLWEGSSEPDSIGAWRRLLQPVFQGGVEHVFCEIAVFQQNLYKR